MENLVNHVFALMGLHPVVSIILSFVLVGLILVVFRKPLEDWFRKKYNLYNKSEIVEAIEEVRSNTLAYSPETKADEALSFTERVLMVLELKR